MPEARTDNRWDRYMRWNAVLADLVYTEEVAGAPVYLDVEDELLERAAEAVGGRQRSPRDALTGAVRAALNRPEHPAGMFGGLLARLRWWKSESGEPPPVIALLAVLSLAAEDMREGEGLAANNYYDRLMPLLGVSSPADKERVVAAYRRCSSQLWEGLNGWLEDLQGERGLPTAYAYTHAHIGRPMSQALVRAADREKLRQLFAEAGLAPRSRMSPHDMEPLLAEWIERNPSPASNATRALWKRAGARQRITEVTCGLLEAWDGPSDRGIEGARAAARGRNAELLALVRTFPSPALELSILGPQIGGSLSPLSLLDTDTDRPLGVALAVDGAPGSRWRLADPGQVDGRSLLEGRLRLSYQGAIFERRPRRVVPLRKDPLLQTFVEVERLPLGEDGLVLTQDALASVVTDALHQVARPGFRRWAPGLPGCPEGWVIFADVQVLTALPEVNPRTNAPWRVELNVLQPLATSQLVVDGGLQLPGRVRQWSSLAPPEVRVASEESQGIRLRVEQAKAIALSAVAVEQDIEDPLGILSLQQLRLPDGDYEISASALTGALSKQSRRLDRVRVRLRSGSNPNPVTTAVPTSLLRPLDDPAAVAGATRTTTSGEAIQGPRVIGTTRLAPCLSTLRRDFPPPAWWDRRRSRSPSRENERSVELVVVPAAEPDDCLHTGAHYIDLPPFYGRTSRASIEGECRRCGLVKRYPAQYRMKQQSVTAKASTAKARKTIRAPFFDVSHVQAVHEDRRVDPDTALDALTYACAGTGAAFEQLALQVEPSQLFADGFLRGLEALGHLEVARDARTFAAAEWEVTPSTLAELADGRFSLVGQRSHRLLTALEDATLYAGARIERTSQAAAPDLVAIAGISAEDVADLVWLVKEGTGIDIQVAPRPWDVMAALLPSLSDALRALPRQALVGFRAAKRWNPEVATWEPVGDASIPGAYQLFGPTTIYCLRDHLDVANGTMRRGDARLVKHAEALRCGESLVGYDSDSATLYLPLGADLPLLYARPAVLASGLLPAQDRRQRLVRYQAVPCELAAQLMTLLSA